MNVLRALLQAAHARVPSKLQGRPVHENRQGKSQVQMPAEVCVLAHCGSNLSLIMNCPPLRYGCDCGVDTGQSTLLCQLAATTKALAIKALARAGMLSRPCVRQSILQPKRLNMVCLCSSM